MIYEYKGITPDGREIEGMIEAENARAARVRLKSGGVYPTEVIEGERVPSEKPGTPASRESGQRADLSLLGRAVERGIDFLTLERIPVAEIALATRQMATLLSAGLTLMESLEAIRDQVERPAFRKLIAALRERVKEGAPFSGALAQYPRFFSPLYLQMVRAGEASGTLAEMMDRLAGFLEHQVQLKNKVASALAYPILMIFVSILILTGMITFVIPRVVVIFQDMNQALPLPTRILIGMSHVIREKGVFILLLAAVAVYILGRWIRTEAGRMKVDGWILRLPLAGGVAKRISLSRFSRTLETLLSGGVPLLSALEIVRTVVRNKVLEEAIGTARENIREGEGIAAPLKRSGHFPPLMIHMIAVGEKSGELEKMLKRVADTYDQELDTVIGALTSLLAPLLILGMGLVVLFIVLAILLPIFQMSSIIR